MQTPLRFHEELGPDINPVPINILLLVLGAFGTYGAIWILDDYTELRLSAFTFVAVPLLALFVTLEFFHPIWRRRYMKSWVLSILTLGVIFTTGIFPLVNALTAEDKVLKRSFANAAFSSPRDYQRGGLGQLFRKRW